MTVFGVGSAAGASGVAGRHDIVDWRCGRAALCRAPSLTYRARRNLYIADATSWRHGVAGLHLPGRRCETGPAPTPCEAMPR